MGLMTAIAEIRAERAQLDEMLAQLERLASVRTPAEPQPPAEQEPPREPAVQPVTTRAKTPTTRGRQGRPWAKVENFTPWRRELLAPALAHKKASRARGKALLAISEALHTLPSGEQVSIGLSMLYEWMKELEEDSEAVAVVATPAATSKSQASRPAQPKNTREWRRTLLADVLPLPEGNAREDALRAVKRSLAELPSEAERRVTMAELREWLKEAESGDAKLERERLQASGEIGNPLQLAKGFNAADRRHQACPAYSACLGYVARRGWKGFTCDGCTGPGQQNGTAFEHGGKSGTAGGRRRSSLRIVGTPKETGS